MKDEYKAVREVMALAGIGAVLGGIASWSVAAAAIAGGVILVAVALAWEISVRREGRIQNKKSPKQ